MRALAQAVIRSAVLDLFSKSLAGATDADASIERHHAMRFLTATGNDDWAMARRVWCFFADVDPDRLRSRIVDVLEGRRDIEAPDETIPYRLNGHGIARQLWAGEKVRQAAHIDDARRQVEERHAAHRTQAEAALPKPAPQPKPAPKPQQPKIDVEKQILEALRNGRETAREVGFDVPSAVIRETLDALVARGLATKDGPRYRLVPKSPHSAPASVLLDAIPTT